MNKTRNYTNQFFLSLLSILLIYLAFIYTRILSLNLSSALTVSGILLLIFALGTLIIAPSLNKDAERFAISFLLLTTVQMLLVFGIIAVIIFKHIPNFRAISFHFIALFCLLLALQSALLIRLKNKTN